VNSAHRLSNQPVIDLRKPDPAYNPYDPATILVGDRESIARPYEFDAEPADSELLTTGGERIRPTKLAGGCPFCGHGIDIVVAVLRDGTELRCGNCDAGPVQLTGVLALKTTPITVKTKFQNLVDEVTAAAEVEAADPFRNPIEAGLISRADLEGTVIPVAVETQASDIFAEPSVAQRMPAPTVVAQTPTPAPAKPKRTKAAKGKKDAPVLDSATDLGPEPE
jgi:hypothetical protein